MIDGNAEYIAKLYKLCAVRLTPALLVHTDR